MSSVECEVYELTFDPDKPVESFLEPSEKILSKGPNVKKSPKRHYPMQMSVDKGCLHESQHEA